MRDKGVRFLAIEIWLIGLTAFAAWGEGMVGILHTFPLLAPDGAYPWSTMVQGADGNFYGTTLTGGPFGGGNVFKVTPDGALSPFYSFTYGNDGAYPKGSLVIGGNGSIYGTASYGGSNTVGTVFKITANGAFTALYSFRTNGVDGQHPETGLVEGVDGNFYGTTSSGGTNGRGTIFLITPAGALTNLHTFTASGGDGSDPTAPLILGADGNFYGTTAYGGTRNQGTVFRMTPQGVWTNLHSFTYADGATPWAGLVQGTDGNFYGTTYSGGTFGYGTVFVITPDGTLTTLYSFSNGADGGSPYAALVQGPNGDLYGTSFGSSTFSPGTNSIGTVFEITPYGFLNTLYTFSNGLDGANPTAGLVLGTNGNFFGTAEVGGIIAWGSKIQSAGRVLGGTRGWGTIFTITPDGTFTPLCAFPSGGEGSNPGAGLIQASDGSLYGVTERGGTNNDGTVFRMAFDGTVTPLYSFTAGADGAVPIAPLVQGNDGSFYGTSYGGGISNAGAVFKITSEGVFTLLHTFTNGSDGGNPFSALVQGTNGNFYGTTAGGGSKNSGGTVFQITPAGALTILHAFTNGSDGAYPTGGLVRAPDGLFYGTTQSGGTNGNGTVFHVTAAGALTPIYSFKSAVDGAVPCATLTMGHDGNFYGICGQGGPYSYGTIFKITPAGSLTRLYAFTGTNDGGYPQSPLVLASDGKLYGTTQSGGDEGYGTVFQVTTNGSLKTLHSFTYYLESGPQSYSAIIQATNGNFYIATEGGGFGYSPGTILRMIVPPVFQSLTPAGGSVVLTWAGETGQTYQLQYNGGLDPSGWSNLRAPIVASGPVVTISMPRPGGDQAFFRLKVIP